MLEFSFDSSADRAHYTIRDSGPAVWNGGFSSFLAVVLLASSSSYVFKTFFKVSGKELLVNVAQLYSTTVVSLGFLFLRNEARRFD